MTDKELSQLYYLKKEIKIQRKRLASLESKAEGCTYRMTGMPHLAQTFDKVGRLAAQIADLKACLKFNLEKHVLELNRLEKFIQNVEDSQMRTILTLRYIKCWGWRRIAFELGRYDEQYPRKKCQVFLKNYESGQIAVQ